MKALIAFRKTLISRKGIMVLILFFLFCKLSFIGYFMAKSGRFSYIPFPTQAIAQEKAIETREVESDVDITGGEDFSSLTILEKKRKEIAKGEEELKQREERLSQLKAEIEERLETLAQTEKRIGKLITLKESEEDKELTKLAKVFEATPPEQAGPMFNKLDVDIAAKILIRMKGRSAGKIWGYVDPDQAVRISNELAKLK